MASKTPKVLVYCRASDPSKQSNNASIPQQISDAIAYKNDRLPNVQWSTASFPEHQPNGFFIDYISGWDRKTKVLSSRPAGIELLRNLSKGDHVIFYDVPRLGRNTAEVAKIEELFRDQGITMHFIHDQIDTSTAQGRFALHLKAAVAEWYSSILSMRVKEANLMKKLRAAEPRQKPQKAEWESGEYVGPEKFTPAPGFSGKVYRYIRCSHTKSYTSGLGLESQERMTARAAGKIAERTRAAIYPAVFEDDAVSAYRKTWLERPAAKALEDLLQPGDHVVVMRVDRGWRTIRDLVNTEARWRAKGVTLHIVDGSLDSSTSEGRLMLTYLSMAAEEEAATKSRYWKAVQERARKNGKPHDGKPKVGYKISTNSGKKRMRLDIEEMGLIFALDYLHHEAGFSLGKASDWAHAIHCWKNKLKPRSEAFRKHADWNRARCWSSIKIVPTVASKLRREVIVRVCKVARDYLTATIPEEFLVRGKTTNPAVVDGRAFLTARQISIGFEGGVTGLLGTQTPVDNLERLHGNEDESGSVLF